jgi:uncharacterized coiled-coil protein SlyX
MKKNKTLTGDNITKLTNNTIYLDQKTSIMDDVIQSHSVSLIEQRMAISKMQLRIKLADLHILDIVSKDEMINIIKMLNSPDKENFTVAEELITNLFNKHL